MSRIPKCQGTRAGIRTIRLRNAGRAGEIGDGRRRIRKARWVDAKASAAICRAARPGGLAPWPANVGASAMQGAGLPAPSPRSSHARVNGRGPVVYGILRGNGRGSLIVVSGAPPAQIAGLYRAARRMAGKPGRAPSPDWWPVAPVSDPAQLAAGVDFRRPADEPAGYGVSARCAPGRTTAAAPGRHGSSGSSAARRRGRRPVR